MTLSDVTQIKIGKHKVGFVGLKEAFKGMADIYAEKPDGIGGKRPALVKTNNYVMSKWC